MEEKVTVATSLSADADWWSRAAVEGDAPAPVELVPVTSKLSQYGTVQYFREVPRWNREKALSMQEGVLEVEEISRIIRGRFSQEEDRVRHFKMQTLCDAEYKAERTPSKQKPNHVSVGAPLSFTEDTAKHKAWWASRSRKPLGRLEYTIPSTVGTGK